MDDPFSALKKTLESVFHLVPLRNGEYVYAEIQQLKNAVENYQSVETDKETSFIKLVQALGEALPHFEKWRINFEAIKNSVDSLARIHKMPAVDWDKYLSHPKVSSRFQFNNTLQDTTLIPWLTAISGKTLNQHESSEQNHVLIDMLIDHSEELGFSQKLKAHLEKDSQFLSQLIMESENNFIKIANTRLILYLTDEQIAKAIIKYSPNSLQVDQNPLIQVEQLVDKINGILSNGYGRSISTLLRNVDAKSILDGNVFFQIYQSEEYKNRQEQSSFSAEEENFKPNF